MKINIPFLKHNRQDDLVVLSIMLEKDPMFFEKTFPKQMQLLDGKVFEQVKKLAILINEEIEYLQSFHSNVERKHTAEEIATQKINEAKKAKLNTLTERLLKMVDVEKSTNGLSEENWQQLNNYFKSFTKEEKEITSIGFLIHDQEENAKSSKEYLNHNLVTEPPLGLKEIDRKIFAKEQKATIKRWHKPNLNRVVEEFKELIHAKREAISIKFREPSKVADIGKGKLVQLFLALAFVLGLDFVLYQEFAIQVLGYTFSKSIALTLAAIVIAKLVGRLLFRDTLLEAREKNITVKFPLQRLMIGLSIFMAICFSMALYSNLAIKDAMTRITQQEEAALISVILDNGQKSSALWEDFMNEEKTSITKETPEIAPVPLYLLKMYALSIPSMLLCLSILSLLAGGFFLADLEILVSPYFAKLALQKKSHQRERALYSLKHYIQARESIILELADIRGYKTIINRKKRDFYQLN